MTRRMNNGQWESNVPLWANPPVASGQVSLVVVSKGHDLNPVPYEFYYYLQASSLRGALQLSRAYAICQRRVDDNG